MRRLWRNYSLSITLAALFLASWLAQSLVQVPEEGWRHFWISTTENWQSEFLQLFTFVVLTSLLVHRGSPESRDSDERIEAKLDWLLRRVGKSPSDFDEQPR